jgi:hypothetical protein
VVYKIVSHNAVAEARHLTKMVGMEVAVQFSSFTTL